MAAQFKSLLKQYPVVTIMGPRQSGKTTLVREYCSDYPYVSLEDPNNRAIASDDPIAFLKQYPEKLIIDEFQHVPALLSYIQTIVDEKQSEGMYILTGSQQPNIHAAVSQSLAGRTALLELLPLNQQELHKASIELSLNEQLLHGGYPRIYNKKLNPTQYYKDYVKTYLERDVRQLINLKDLMLFQKFIKLCAARTGCVFNASNLANDVGVSQHTVNHWVSILQASYLVRFLTPYHENFGKQAIKSPKLYFTDVGLAVYLLEIESLPQLQRDPLYGNLFETFVVMDLIKTRFNIGREPNLYYYRDAQKHEVDLIYKKGNELIPIEIKSTQTYRKELKKGLLYFKKIVGDRCGKMHLIYAGDKTISLSDCDLINYKHCREIFKEPEQ